VLVLRAMAKWYPWQMSSASDTSLRAMADQKMRSAESVIAPQMHGDPGPDDPGEFWDSLSTRAQKAIRSFRAELSERGGPGKERLDVIKGAARDVQGAAQAGLDKGSSAIDSVRSKLRTAARAAGALWIGASLAPMVLPLLIVFAIESSGYGKRARGAARRAVSARARSYGF
jgi:hypothetical protein